MPCPGSSQQHQSWHPLASGFDSMQGLTATLRRVNASRSLAFHLGSMSDSASAYRPHVSRIHPLHPENCNSPNTTRAARQSEPCSCIHGGLHTTRQPCWAAATYDPAIRPIQPSYRLPSHPSACPIPIEPPNVGMGCRPWIVDHASRAIVHGNLPFKAPATNPN